MEFLPYICVICTLVPFRHLLSKYLKSFWFFSSSKKTFKSNFNFSDGLLLLESWEQEKKVSHTYPLISFFFTFLFVIWNRKERELENQIHTLGIICMHTQGVYKKIECFFVARYFLGHFTYKNENCRDDCF